MSDFHSITPYGSKVCHGSVTGVTCDTTVAGCDSAPPLGLSPQRPRRKKGKHVYTCKKKWKGKFGKGSESSKKEVRKCYKSVCNNRLPQRQNWPRGWQT